MKTYLKIIILFLVLVSCQNDNKKENSFKSELEKAKTSNKKDKDVSKDLKPTKILTNEVLNKFFPEKIGSYNRIVFGESLGNGSATYINGTDYGDTMLYYITDGHKKGSAVIRNFEGSYQSNKEWPEGTELISMERDGFKTVALLRHNYNNYKISTIYNNRFALAVEGHEKPDALWSYLKQANLKILDSY